MVEDQQHIDHWIPLRTFHHAVIRYAEGQVVRSAVSRNEKVDSVWNDLAKDRRRLDTG